MQENTPLRAPRKTDNDTLHLSYKFQRLREQLRADILGGVFGEKLPGERKLGQRYNANAKTINKALGDLTSEGLLVRHIGLGTFRAHTRRESVHSRAKVLRCLHLENAEENRCRDGLLEELRHRAVADGSRLEELPVLDVTNSHEIRLSDWPAPTRSTTSGLILVSRAPLDGRGGRLGDDLIMEAYRRHVPLVLAGSLNGCHKINSVVPDFVDAGYRLGEHLFQVGCEFVVAVYGTKGREADAVLSGCRSAATRYGCDMRECGHDAAADNGGDLRGNMSLTGRVYRSAPRVGVVCIGAAALDAVQRDSSFAAEWTDGRVGLACVVDPGQTITQEREITSYEVSTSHVARWALWLLSTAPSERRPVEMIVPGRLEIRRTIAPATNSPFDTTEGAWTQSTVPDSAQMAEVAI